MSILMTNHELVKVKHYIHEGNNKVKDLWNSLYERTMGNTKETGLIQAGDTQEWWHLIWERLSDAAFVYAVSPSDRLKDWLRAVVLEVCRKPDDDWIGPWFRTRKDPPEGQLETAHVGLAVATVTDLCPEIFNADELALVKKSLRVKAQQPCRTYLENKLSSKAAINNWFVVLLNGFGTVSAILKDEEAVSEAAELYKTAIKLYNKDSYGESLQYSNYTNIHLVHLNEVLTRYKPALGGKLDRECYTRLIPWQVSSFMHMKPLGGLGKDAYPRTINLGDSAAIYRPSGDVLVHIAARMKASCPKEAGLARWLFEETYQNAGLEPTERASFGFFNSYQFHTLLLYPEAAETLPPEQAELPLCCCYETGNIIVRDAWKDTKTVLGIQGGYESNHVATHLHEDQNSFVLSHLKERFFADSGHCCYRLATQAFSRSTEQHNTWSFEVEEDGKREILRQRGLKSTFFEWSEPMNQRLIAKTLDGISVIASDAAGVYGSPVTKARRMWIAAMPHTLFIIDRIEASKPVKVRSHFLLNNRDNRLQTNVAAEHKLVFRRLPAAVKFFQVKAVSDGEENRNKLSFGYGYIHDCYHPKPNQLGQGAEGSGLIYTYTSAEFKKSHTIVYAIAMDAEKNITGWHIKNLSSDMFFVEPPLGKGGYSIQLLGNDEIRVKNHLDDTVFTVSEDDFFKE